MQLGARGKHDRLGFGAIIMLPPKYDSIIQKRIRLEIMFWKWYCYIFF